MKTTYLINKIQPDGSVRLCVASSAEWMAIVKGNKKIPTEQRRYFILDYIADGDNLDCMVIETSLEEYRSWDRSRSAEKRNRCAKQKFQHLSLNTPLNDSETSETLLDMISADEQVESMVCDSIMIDELKKTLADWKPWANDMLEMYLNGQKRACTDILARKYGVSSQIIRKYKRQFEKFIKIFWRDVSF